MTISTPLLLSALPATFSPREGDCSSSLAVAVSVSVS